MATHKVVRADLTEIVFEHREKAYGAYQMRRKYNQSLMIALLLTLSGFSIAVGAPKVWTLMMLEGPNPRKSAPIIEEVTLTDHQETFKKKEPEPLVPVRRERIRRPPIEQIRFLVTEPVPDDLVIFEDTVPDISDLENATNIGIVNSEGDSTFNDYIIPDDSGTGIGDIFIEEDTVPGWNSWVDVSRLPSAINMEEITKLIGYPRDAREVGIEGKVIVRILVGKDGSYMEHRIVKSAHPILKKAVEAQLENISFLPGLHGNNPVYVWVNIPFHFYLN